MAQKKEVLTDFTQQKIGTLMDAIKSSGSEQFAAPQEFERPVGSRVPVEIPDEQLKGLSDIERSAQFQNVRKQEKQQREQKLNTAQLIKTVREQRAKTQSEQALKKQFTLEEINNILASGKPVNEDADQQITDLIEEGKFLPTEEREIQEKVNKVKRETSTSPFQGIQNAASVGIDFLNRLIGQQEDDEAAPTKPDEEVGSTDGYPEYSSEEEARANGAVDGDIVIIGGQAGVLE